jgi:hypothetical protein
MLCRASNDAILSFSAWSAREECAACVEGTVSAVLNELLVLHAGICLAMARSRDSLDPPTKKTSCTWDPKRARPLNPRSVSVVILIVKASEGPRAFATLPGTIVRTGGALKSSERKSLILCKDFIRPGICSEWFVGMRVEALRQQLAVMNGEDFALIARSIVSNLRSYYHTSANSIDYNHAQKLCPPLHSKRWPGRVSN